MKTFHRVIIPLIKILRIMIFIITFQKSLVLKHLNQKSYLLISLLFVFTLAFIVSKNFDTKFDFEKNIIKMKILLMMMLNKKKIVTQKL